MRKLLEEVQTGTRKIANTDWPVVDQLHQTGRKEWTITRGLCNGTPRGAEVFQDEDEAREAFGRRLDGRTPRTEAASVERVTIRLSGSELAAIDQAAAALGETRSDFVRAAAFDRAAKVGQ